MGIVSATGELDLAGVLTRLAELGPASEIRGHGPELAAAALALDRVLLSSIRDGLLIAESLHLSDGNPAPALAALQDNPVQLSYPLIEGEIMRRRRPQVVRVEAGEAKRRCAFATILGWTEYAAAPVLLDGTVIGFLHGDRRPSGGTLQDSDALALASFAVCFAIVYERAVLRHRLRVQHREMRQVASWADTRTSELGDRSITLDEDSAETRHTPITRPGDNGDAALRDLLTRRELEVLQLMVRGETNAGIARNLVVSEGTVKFHVKNILRKTHAANRAEATSRYLRLTLNRPG
jgi:DNA-binding CsgD family transcriptional regulator